MLINLIHHCPELSQSLHNQQELAMHVGQIALCVTEGGIIYVYYVIKYTAYMLN